MKLSAKCMLLTVSVVSLPALAQEQGAAFENFLLFSPSIVSPSQYYQVKGGRFEALAGLLNATFESKTSDFEADASGQLLGVGYSQGLSSQLVLGADVRYIATSTDVPGGDSDSSNTEIRPLVAFSLTPLFSLGASINVFTGQDEFGGESESYSYNTFTVGGTLHQELWEATLALTTSNEDDEKASANAAQDLTIHGRYRFMPVLALGLRYTQLDYPGIEQAGDSLETENSYAVILESALSDNSRVEVAFQSFSNRGGEENDDATEIFLSGGFDLASNMEIGAQVRLDTAESDISETSMQIYALTFSMVN